MFNEEYKSTKTKSESLATCINSYENHYNNKLDRCFILSRSECFKDGDVYLDVGLTDVFEQKSYASYHAVYDKKGFVTGRICTLGDTSFIMETNEELKAPDPIKEKFDKWVKPYMEE